MIQRVAARYLQRLLSAAKKKFYPRGPGQKWFRRKQKGRKRTDSRRNYRIKKKQIARQQIKYRRRGIAKMKRKRWLRKFKRNPHKYRYRRGAEMQQIVEKVALRFIQKKKRRYTDKLRDKMRYKKNRSKVKQRGKKHRKKPSVKRRTKKVQKHRQKNPQLHKMRYAFMKELEMEIELRDKVIRLAHSKPHLQPDLLPLLKEASSLDYQGFLRDAKTRFQTEVRDKMMRIMGADGCKGYRGDPPALNGYTYTTPAGALVSWFVQANFEGDAGGEFAPRDGASQSPYKFRIPGLLRKDAQAWAEAIWKGVPAVFKK